MNRPALNLHGFRSPAEVAAALAKYAAPAAVPNLAPAPALAPSPAPESKGKSRSKSTSRNGKTTLPKPKPAAPAGEPNPDTSGKPAAPLPPPAATSLVGDRDYVTRMYFREMAVTPLLTVKEEGELAEKIRQGDDAARERMIKANLRLVVKIAADFAGFGQLPIADLINEGNIGLMRAVEKFDPRKGAKLSTYAAWWIKQSILRALANQGRTIRLPVHVVSLLYKVRRVAEQLSRETGFPATDAEVAAETGLTEGRVHQLRTLECDATNSFDDGEGDDDGSQYGRGGHAMHEKVADELAVDPATELETNDRHALLLELLEELPDREQQILRHRFGLDGLSEETLEQVGQRFGVTRERIRQVQNIALKRLRVLVERHERTPDEQMPSPKAKRARNCITLNLEPRTLNFERGTPPPGLARTAAERRLRNAEMLELWKHDWSVTELADRYQLSRAGFYVALKAAERRSAL
jgi:RNA polymerase primary sigma factor